MILTNSNTIGLLRTAAKYWFTQQKISPSRFQIIKHHSLHTEYDGLKSSTTPHLINNWRLIEDETHLKFLVEQGGFPGCSDIGILLKLGSQNETRQNAGSLFCLKNLVHMKPQFQDSIKNYQFLNRTGSTVDFNYDVESTYVKCSFFEEDIDIMVDLILDLGLREKKLFEENFQTEGQILDFNEQVRVTAFAGKGIGMPSSGLGLVLSNNNFIEFQRKYVTPHNTVISMSNVKNPQGLIKNIKDKIKSRYPQFLMRKKPSPVISNYRGGMESIINNESPFFQFAVAFPGAHYKSPKMELYNILRVLLGSASSFSSGGPGKGMHSRCTKNLLNKVRCIESASYILTHYQHFGLFGITASGTNEDAQQVIKETLREFAKLKQPITEEQLQRAKNILVASVYTNIERQSDRLEELTKHINSYDRIKISEYQNNIRAVTSEDIYRQIQSIYKFPPTFVLRGSQQALKFGNMREMKKSLLI